MGGKSKCVAEVIESFHLKQSLPDSAPSSTISSISGVPLNSIFFLLPSQHLWCTKSFPPTNNRRQQRNWPLAGDVLRGSRKTLSCELAAAISHAAPPSPKNSTASPLVSCEIQRNCGMKAIASHSCRCLVTLRSLPSPRLVFWILHLRVALPVLCTSFPLLLTSGQRLGWHLLLQNLHSSSPRRWFGDFVQHTCSSLITGYHSTHKFLMLSLHTLSFILLLHIISQLYHRNSVSSHPGWRHAFLQSAASSSLTHQLLFASIPPFALTFLVTSAMTCLISHVSVVLSCMPFFHCKS